jgi:hypothetical protein
MMFVRIARLLSCLYGQGEGGLYIKADIRVVPAGKTAVLCGILAVGTPRIWDFMYYLSCRRK